MNDSKVLEILEQLHNFTLEKTDRDSLPEYPLLEPDYVKNIAKSITEIVYRSYERNTLNAKKSRDTIIELLYKWTDSNTHLPITDSNLDNFIKCLNAKQNSKVEDLDTYSELFIDTDKSNTDDWNTICSVINRKYKANLEEKLKLNLVQIWDSSRLRKAGFEFTFLVKNIQNTETENSIEYLRCLKREETDTKSVELNEKISQNDDGMGIIDVKDKFDHENTTIELGYALLYGNNNSERNKFLVSIIERISHIKNASSIKFIDYLWLKRTKLNLPQNVYTNAFLCFPYLYEKPVIQLATFVLESVNSVSDIEEYQRAINTFGLKDILLICQPVPKLLNNIMAVFDSLLRLSLFDTRLLMLVNVVRSNCLHVNKE